MKKRSELEFTFLLITMCTQKPKRVSLFNILQQQNVWTHRGLDFWGFDITKRGRRRRKISDSKSIITLTAIYFQRHFRVLIDFSDNVVAPKVNKIGLWRLIKRTNQTLKTVTLMLRSHAVGRKLTAASMFWRTGKQKQAVLLEISRPVGQAKVDLWTWKSSPLGNKDGLGLGDACLNWRIGNSVLPWNFRRV